MDENSLITTVCLIDDFCNQFELEWKASKKSHLLPGGDARRKRSPQKFLLEHFADHDEAVAYLNAALDSVVMR